MLVRLGLPFEPGGKKFLKGTVDFSCVPKIEFFSTKHFRKDPYLIVGNSKA